jgi:hypothetical protein
VTLRSLPLETELFIPPPHGRDPEIIARHYGFDGNGGANFKHIGDEIGLTRERVRQIVSKIDPRVYLNPEGIPTLQRLLAIVAANLPAPAAILEAMLRDEGITAGLFRLEGILEIASLLHCPAAFRLTSLKGVRFAVAEDYPRFEDIVVKAHRMVRRHGMASLADCLTGNRQSEDARRESDLVEVVLSAQNDFQWLDRGSGWFWFSRVRGNRVARRIRKMFAVASRLSIAEIRAGLARMGDTLAPNHVLLEFCRRMPELSVDGEMISAKKGIRAGDVLNPTERAIFRLLSEHDGCLSNSELICRSRVLGLKRPSFYQCVSSSPIVSRYKRTYYRLIGSRQAIGGAAH